MRVRPALVASGTAMVVAPIGKGGCTPAWDGSGSLTGSAIVNRINAIRKAGGDIVVSFAKGISWQVHLLDAQPRPGHQAEPAGLHEGHRQVPGPTLAVGRGGPAECRATRLRCGR